jgi:hypothetical protein
MLENDESAYIRKQEIRVLRFVIIVIAIIFCATI